MEDQQENKYSHPVQYHLPYSNAVLVLGILSIVLSVWYVSILGVVLSVIALVLAKKDLALYTSNRSQFTYSSYKKLKAGRVCAIIGLVIAIVFFFITLLSVLGILATMPFWGMIE